MDSQPTPQAAITRGSPVGDAISVSASYQLDYGSVPFGGVGKLGTDTFRLQWQTALAASSTVQHIFMSSFNEFIAQPQPNGLPQPYGTSMGLEWDPARTELWVDSFGCSLARDIEPSVECGNDTYALMVSCVRAMTLIQHYKLSNDDAKTQWQFGIRGEACTASSASFQLVWSLRTTSASDYLISNEVNEVEVLVASGNWEQICNGYGSPTAFCIDGNVLTQDIAVSGPFLTSTRNITGGNPLYRCVDTNGQHFFTNDPGCEGCKLDMLLGFTSPTRSSEFPRSIRRCFDAAKFLHYHSLDYTCRPGDNQEAMYGFVR